MKLSRVDNLLLNMSAGLEPKDLTQEEVALLKHKFGEDWLFKLGYQTNLEFLEAKEKKYKEELHNGW
jgi:hypothetical protein